MSSLINIVFLDEVGTTVSPVEVDSTLSPVEVDSTISPVGLDSIFSLTEVVTTVVSFLQRVSSEYRTINLANSL